MSEIEDFLIGEFVLFDGSTLTRLSMDVDRAVEEGEGLGFDFLEYTDKYPYLIDRNQVTLQGNDSYIEPEAMVVKSIKDQVHLLQTVLSGQEL